MYLPFPRNEQEELVGCSSGSVCGVVFFLCHEQF